MNDRTGPRGGGAFLALATIVGAVGGTIAGQPTIGLLAGAGIGTLAAAAVWWKDRGRH